MPIMEASDLTARQYWEQVKANPNRAKFGFGDKAAVINIDLQCAYTDIDTYKTAYQTNPGQIDYINEISALARAKNMPVIWTHVVYGQCRRCRHLGYAHKHAGFTTEY